MMRRAVIICLALLLGVVMAVAFRGLPGPADPIQRGKAVSAWMVELTSSDHRIRGEAADTIRALGPTALPQLIRGLQKKDLPLQQAAAALARRIPGIRIPFADSKPIRVAAAWMLGGLGPRARPAVPNLIDALRDADADVRLEVERSLRRVGL